MSTPAIDLVFKSVEFGIGQDLTEARAELTSLSSVVSAAIAVLDKRERRCHCGKRRTYKRVKVMLVGEPNVWCDEHYEHDRKTWRCHPSLVAERDEYQDPEIVALRAALEAAGAIAKEST